MALSVPQRYKKRYTKQKVLLVNQVFNFTKSMIYNFPWNEWSHKISCCHLTFWRLYCRMFVSLVISTFCHLRALPFIKVPGSSAAPPSVHSCSWSSILVSWWNMFITHDTHCSFIIYSNKIGWARANAGHYLLISQR